MQKRRKKTYSCQLCGQQQSHNYNRHQKRKHPGMECLWKCLKCNMCMSSVGITQHQRCRPDPLRFDQTWAQFCGEFVPEPGPGLRTASMESKRRNALCAYGNWLRLNGAANSSLGDVLTTPSLLRTYLKESTQLEDQMTHSLEQKSAEISDASSVIRRKRIGGAGSSSGRLDVAQALLSAVDFVLEQQLLLSTEKNMALFGCQRTYGQVRPHTHRERESACAPVRAGNI